MKQFTLLLIAFLLAVPAVSAGQGTIALLALIESDGNSTGTLASLDLETRSGAERVFLETVPLTKIATQISMRFAQQIACAELDKECTSTDFFYTIRATPGIVGGPSAGAAAAVLAAALLDSRTLDSSVGVTGTINSGGLIGPVGGLQQKIQAAAAGGLKKVLIPAGTAILKEDGKTVSLVEYGKSVGIEVVEVSTLDDALQQFTGNGIVRAQTKFSIEPSYAALMKEIALDLCSRSSGIPDKIGRASCRER